MKRMTLADTEKEGKSWNDGMLEKWSKEEDRRR
jgi:hypothetical protein